MIIHVLGSGGMLGSYVSQYFENKGYQLVRHTRNSINIALDVSSQHSILFNEYDHLFFPNDVIINCAGIIKPRIAQVGIQETIKVNSLFPHILSDFCNQSGVKLIHITTDCVYSGFVGKYDESSLHDALDLYGKSKSMGEPRNCTVIRTSIIGEEKNNKRSLVEWIKSQVNQEVNGYTNHLWNGITCLQFAKCVEEIILNNLYWGGVKHVYSPEDLTKFNLVKLISDVYELDITVKRALASEYCNRTLRTNIPIFNIPTLRDQIKEMREFELK